MKEPTSATELSEKHMVKNEKTGTSEGLGKPEGLGRKQYKKVLNELQVELVKLQHWVLYKKLKVGIQRTIKETGDIPPIVVRPNYDKRCYEIIDGEHRWKVLKDLGENKIRVYSIEVRDEEARVLTNTLNYLRGSPNREKYSKGIVELLGLGMKTSELSSLLPESAEELDALVEEADITLEAFKTLKEEDEDALDELAKSGQDDEWVDLKFRVTAQQAQVIEKEIKRISDHISGKNKRGRSLEYMAAQSTGTVIE